MPYILALDQGTTSSRALIVDEQGRVLSVAQKEFPQHFPASGWVEHDANEIWQSQLFVALEAMKKARLTADEIAAVGIANQRETTVLWDRKTSEPVGKAIVWQDRRTVGVCEKLKKEGLEALFMEKTGLLLDPYFSGTKLSWMLDHIPGARKKAEKGELAFGTIDSWLVWKLTEGNLHITDATNASRTLLYNIHELKWDEKLLEHLRIPSSVLPKVMSSSEIYGKTAPSLFSKPIPIGGIAGDQQAALFGQMCTGAGSAKATYGTGCFILMNTGKKPVLSKNHLLTTIALQIGKETSYALEGSVFNAGAAIQWLRDQLGILARNSDIEKLALSVPDTGGVYTVPAFTGLGAPHWDPYARGAIVGLSRGTSAAHIARSVLESIAFQAADVLKAMESDSGISLLELRVDGGVVASDLLMQFQADLMATPVLRPQNKELTGLGVAFLAGLAVGLWKNQEELTKIWTVDRQFQPQMDQAEREKRFHLWHKAVFCAKGWEEVR